MMKIFAVDNNPANLLLVEKVKEWGGERWQVVNGGYDVKIDRHGVLTNFVNDIKAYFVMNAPSGHKVYDPKTRTYPVLDAAEDWLRKNV
jgi:hypothetical protein